MQSIGMDMWNRFALINAINNVQKYAWTLYTALAFFTKQAHLSSLHNWGGNVTLPTSIVHGSDILTIIVIYDPKLSRCQLETASPGPCHHFYRYLKHLFEGC